MSEINIPINELINMYNLLSEASENINAANRCTTLAYKMLCDDNIYKGNSESNLEIVSRSLTGNYEKISMVFSILKQYLLEVLNDYEQKEKEIEKYIESEYARMRGN